MSMLDADQEKSSTPHLLQAPRVASNPANVPLLPTSIELLGNNDCLRFEDAWSPGEHQLSQMRVAHEEIRRISSPPVSSLSDTGLPSSPNGAAGSDEAVPLIMHRPAHPLSFTRMLPVLRRKLFSKWFIAVLIAITYLTCIITHELLHVNREKDPEVERFSKLVRCAEKLSQPALDCTKSDTSHCKALQWFLGPGNNVDPEDTCSWDTDFGMLYALIVVRESLGVPDASWNSDRSIRQASDVCHWTRIHCINGRVTGLFLNHANLTGALAKEVNGLVRLRELEVYSNQGLAGSIPSEIGRMTSLESLKLQHTSLGGRVPSEIGHLTALKELLIDGTLLTGEMPKEIYNLRNGELESLHASCRGDHALLHCTCCSSCKTIQREDIESLSAL